MNKENSHQITALIAAGGVGSRFAAGSSASHKQCLELGGKPLYMWCVLAFLSNTRISNVVVVAHKDICDGMKREIDETLARVCPQKSNAIAVVRGGVSRQESVYLGLQHLDGQNRESTYVLVHDAARPFIKQSLIDDTIDCVLEYGACTTAVAVSDTVKRVDGGSIVETLDRSQLFAAQTPQAARLDWLLEAHALACSQGLAATDDAFILENANHEVKIVPGDKYNIKVTIPEDLQICQAICHMFISQINGCTA